MPMDGHLEWLSFHPSGIVISVCTRPTFCHIHMKGHDKNAHITFSTEQRVCHIPHGSYGSEVIEFGLRSWKTGKFGKVMKSLGI